MAHVAGQDRDLSGQVHALSEGADRDDYVDTFETAEEANSAKRRSKGIISPLCGRAPGGRIDQGMRGTTQLGLDVVPESLLDSGQSGGAPKRSLEPTGSCRSVVSLLNEYDDL